ncbi:MAG: class I adenylate-forming enzyme family protein [Ramlibacter sp.]|nr:class I adenylate-forming enzyme family protein [Ramlibacter sp.]
MNIVEEIRNNAIAFPDQPALIGTGRQMTYRQLIRTVATLAAHLSQAGVRPHDRVGLQVSGARPMIISTLAIGWLGAVSVTLPIGQRKAGDDALALACGVTHLLHNLRDPQAEDLPAWCNPISLRALDMKSRPAELPEMVQVEPGALSRIGVSSGTTGLPKAIASSVGELIVRTHLVRAVYPLTPADRVLVAMAAGMPFAFHYWMRPLHCGAAVAIANKFEPQPLLQAIHRDGITVVVTTPATAIDMAQVAADPASEFGRPAPGLHTMISGGGAMTPATQAALRRHVCPGLSINYGSSEAGLIAVADAALQQSKPRCAGRIVPWMEVQAVDDADAPLPPGTMGRLRMRSMTMAQGYIGQEGTEAGAGFRDGWFYTGDRGRVRPDGLVFLGGRTDEVLNVSGGKVDAARVEAVIAEDPTVIECAVVVAEPQVGKQILVAVVVSNSAVDKEAIMRRCAGQLGQHLAPKAVVQVDKLPRNEGGKVMREQLRRSIHVEKNNVTKAAR